MRRLLTSRPFVRLRSSLRAIVHRRRLESDMEAELANHLEDLTADLIRAGHSPAEAARRARIALGPALVHKEGMRASLGLRWWDELGADLRYGIRILRKSPGFTAIAATSLALAIGVNTTIFSIAKQLLYDRLNVPHPEQLRMLRWHGDGKLVHNMWGEFDSGSAPIFSYPAYLALRSHNHAMRDIFAFKENTMNATIRGKAQRAAVSMVSGNFYTEMGVRPQLGRPIQLADDAVPGAGTVAVISDGLWAREFARSAAVLGQTIIVNQALFTIVGVNPRGFTGAKNVQASPDIFVPLSMQPIIAAQRGTASLLTNPDFWWLNIMARTKPGIPDTLAQAALDVQLEAAIRGSMSVKAGESIPLIDLSDGSRGMHLAEGIFKKPVYVLAALTGLVLLLACANIANLLLARGARRQREMSVRLALGAGRARILRQLLTESLLLAALGGLGGLMLGDLGRNAIPRLLANAWERNDLNVPFDWGVFAFATLVTVLTGLLFGLAPAWLAARAEVSSRLKETSQTATRRRRGLSGKAIVAFQIALSTLLVVGAGLFLRTLLALNSVDVGFRTDHLLLLQINPPLNRYGPGKDVQLHQRLEHGFAALPGVESVAPGWEVYISNSASNTDFLPEGEVHSDDHRQAEFVNVVGNAFFQTMGIPVVGGRAFGSQDTESSQKVAIINQALAKKRFPNANPIGRRFQTGDGEKEGWVQIVGICADTRYTNLRDDPPGQFFMPYVQRAQVGTMTYAVRTPLAPSALVPALRSVVQQTDRDLPIIDVRTQKEQIDASIHIERTFAALTAGFGVLALALALACVGIYGIMAYSVAQRTNEIGIRLALGAQPGQVRSMILRESTWLTTVGIVGGVGGALGLTRLVKSMLYGIPPNDPLTFSTGILILIAVALAASWIPARRAARVQPMEALRHE